MVSIKAVEALEYPQEVRGVLSFDFDGTLHVPTENPPLSPAFFEKVQQLREEGWIWGINTGRSLPQMIDGFGFGKFPFYPDFLVAREREIFTPGQFGRWVPVEAWKKKSAKDHKKFYRQTKKFLKEVEEFVDSETDAEWVEEENGDTGVISTTIEEMQRIVDYIEKHRGKYEMLGYLRNTIYLRFSHVDYHKGTALQEVARLAGVDKQHVFVIGDGHNDLDKLHPDVAGMIACVGNADEVVKEHVREQGGYVAEGIGSLGTIEALEHFLS
ncbi:hypothetical protein Rhal01_01266 [Rubritalea halochordaticola]|uniref:HAD family phosphatase n=1 Tax=Rubritalea halochordaticola TaxID=714537 RepID=A0ABP9V0G4_9BACT